MKPYSFPEILKKFIEKFGVTTVPLQEKAALTIDADEFVLRNYLGTYFPRSYEEIFSLYAELLRNQQTKAFLENKEEINVVSFGFGTAADIVALIVAIGNFRSHIKRINLIGFEGNELAIQYAERILDQIDEWTNVEIRRNLHHCRLNRYTGFEPVVEKLKELEKNFDIIQSNKVCGELYLQDIAKYPYYTFVREMTPFLNEKGILLVGDVTIQTPDRDRSPWNWYPMMMNREVNCFEQAFPNFKTLFPLACNCYGKKCRYPNCFTSFKPSNFPEGFCFRIIAKRKFVEELNLARDNVQYFVSDTGWTRICQCSEGNASELVDARSL